MEPMLIVLLVQAMVHGTTGEQTVITVQPEVYTNCFIGEAVEEQRAKERFAKNKAIVSYTVKAQCLPISGGVFGLMDLHKSVEKEMKK